MPAGFISMHIEGMDKLLNSLDQLSGEKMDNIEDIVEAGVRDMATEAKLRVPKNLGGLANSISVAHPGRFTFELIVQKFYAPYVNFGTGLYASQFLGSVEKEWSDYARQFFVNGKGRVKGNGFFTYAVDNHKTKIIEQIKNELLR